MRVRTASEFGTFGEFLAFLLHEHGCRPKGSPEQPGDIWILQEFADAVGAPLRTARNWPKKSGKKPINLRPIEKALFGDNPQYDPWRKRLRELHQGSNEDESDAKQIQELEQSTKRLIFGEMPPRLYSFVGREQEIETIGGCLADPHGVGRVVIHGLGGIGKSSVAAAYVRLHAEEYAGVIWCSGDSRSALLARLADVANELSVFVGLDANIEKTAQRLLRWVSDQPSVWLLVYDNVGAPSEIAGLIPERNARLLLTSRFSNWSDWANELEVEVLPIREAVALLTTVAGDSDTAGAANLAQALGRLPLALDHAAATCRSGHLSFGVFATKVEKLLAIPQPDAPYPRSVFATFTLALEESLAFFPPAQRLMSFLARCSPDPIPSSIIELAFDDETLRVQSLRALGRTSLIRPGSDENVASVVHVHRLVQSVARAKSEFDPQPFIQVIEAPDLIPHDTEDPSNWPIFGLITPHLLSLGAHANEVVSELPRWAGILHAIASYLYVRGRYDAAEPLARKAVEIGQAHPSGDLSIYFSLLGHICQGRGDYLGARRYFEQSIAVSEEFIGRFDILTVSRWLDLGNHFQAMHCYAEAMQIVDEILDLFEQNPEYKSGPTYLSARELQAVCLFYQGKAEEAAEIFEDVFKANSGRFGVDHAKTLSAASNFGRALEARGDLDQAQALLNRVHALYCKVFGEEHPDTAMTLWKLADVLAQKGNHKDACTLFEKCLASLNNADALNHHNLSPITVSFAACCRALGDDAKAKELLQNAIRITQVASGNYSPETLRLTTELADIFLDNGNLPEARELLEPICSQDMWGELHYEMARCCDQYARLNSLEGNLSEAVVYFQQALCTWRECLPDDSRIVANAYLRVARAQYRAGEKGSSVEENFEQAIRIHSAASSASHRDLATALHAYSIFLSRTAQARRAAAIRSKTVGTLYELYGKELIKSAMAMVDLGESVTFEAEYIEGRYLFEESVAILRTALGEDHPTTNIARRHLADALYFAGKYKTALKHIEIAIAAHEQHLGEKAEETKRSAHSFVRTMTALGHIGIAARVGRKYGIAVRANPGK